MALDTYSDTMTGLDMISDLPDSMLCHILSFLPTKEAVQTSILSKRWMGLWLFVPTLHFEEDSAANYMQHFNFIRMIYIVFLERKMAHVKKFSLKFNNSTRKCYGDANAWVEGVLDRGAQHLDLRLHHRMRLPYATIGSRTLVVLKLTCLSVNTIVINGFPSLKVLHLNDVDFNDDQCLKHFLFGCPILEELSIHGLTISPSSNKTMITNGELQSLNNLVSVVLLFYRHYIPLKWICKVKSLRLYENSNFNCTFPNLTSLVLLIDHYKWSCLINDVLRNCPNLQHFEINHKDNSICCLVDCEKWLQPEFVPECLSMHLRTCTLRYYQGLECELFFSEYIMKNAEVIRIMRICSEVFSDPEAKLKVRRKLSMFPKISAECEIHLNVK